MKTVQDILEKILLPVNSSWQISNVSVNESTEEIEVNLEYALSYIMEGESRYSIYDHRPLRRWRHLDLWQYKTYITARLPRYRDSNGFYHSVEIPWAGASEQMTDLLKKK